MKTKSIMDSKIKLFLIKTKMKLDLNQFNWIARWEQTLNSKGLELNPVDLYGEENWDE
jgi:hypothetical protein